MLSQRESPPRPATGRLPTLTRLNPRGHLAAAPGFVVVALMILWAVHNGGYDADTWYWGALVLLATLGTVAIGLGPRLRLSRAGAVALTAFALYVAWSYLSITWAASPGDALEGSNKALLYLLAFALMLLLPWTPEAALAALVTFAIGVGVLGIVILARLASADHVARLVIQGRLAAPTGYINSTAALFTIEALVATALAARRELPVLLRALLISFACAGLQLALIVQSRGWLFTLPLVLLVAILLMPDRLRVLVAAALPAIAILAPLHRLLQVYQAAPGSALNHAASAAGKAGLVLCGVMLIAGGLIAWGEQRLRPRPLSPARRRAIGATLAVLVVAAGVGGGVAATHGHPFHFVSKQWRGFTKPQTVYSSKSHFADVGSGRYDFWRVSINAFIAHPIGGLGQDNFADYYLKHRHTSQEPQWPHSLELRLLALTGIVGTLLFVAFLIGAITGALRVRRRADTPIARAVAAVALLPLVVWVIHGSIDWFWEMPALSVPALGFLGMATALASPGLREQEHRTTPAGRRKIARVVAVVFGALAFCAAVVTLGFPYLSVREVSTASNIAARDPSGALRDLDRAADLNPLSSEPGQIGGTIALRTGDFAEAERRFEQETSREPGAWFGWLGAGLAASELGHKATAHHDFVVAVSINSKQPADTEALARVYSSLPLTTAEAFRALVTEP